eukprot:TRINITY_DN5700_c0_g1_i9.p1 TRINITY_DN5700_c0_g1~~TRINITY_DN5700_c0_g1_i9.p1  ORF type:complete len:1133 (-),score=264.64 TRINITY_DN5700_c0_g1_i9:73-3471(-)
MQKRMENPLQMVKAIKTSHQQMQIIRILALGEWLPSSKVLSTRQMEQIWQKKKLGQVSERLGLSEKEPEDGGSPRNLRLMILGIVFVVLVILAGLGMLASSAQMPTPEVFVLLKDKPIFMKVDFCKIEISGTQTTSDIVLKAYLSLAVGVSFSVVNNTINLINSRQISKYEGHSCTMQLIFPVESTLPGLTIIDNGDKGTEVIRSDVPSGEISLNYDASVPVLDFGDNQISIMGKLVSVDMTQISAGLIRMLSQYRSVQVTNVAVKEGMILTSEEGGIYTTLKSSFVLEQRHQVDDFCISAPNITVLETSDVPFKAVPSASYYTVSVDSEIRDLLSLPLVSIFNSYQTYIGISRSIADAQDMMTYENTVEQRPSFYPDDYDDILASFRPSGENGSFVTSFGYFGIQGPGLVPGRFIYSPDTTTLQFQLLLESVNLQMIGGSLVEQSPTLYPSFCPFDGFTEIDRKLGIYGILYELLEGRPDGSVIAYKSDDCSVYRSCIELFSTDSLGKQYIDKLLWKDSSIVMVIIIGGLFIAYVATYVVARIIRAAVLDKVLAFREKFRFRVNLKRRLQVLRASSKKKKPKKKPVDDDDESIDGKKEDDKDQSNLKQKPMFPDEDEKDSVFIKEPMDAPLILANSDLLCYLEDHIKTICMTVFNAIQGTGSEDVGANSLDLFISRSIEATDSVDDCIALQSFQLEYEAFCFKNSLKESNIFGNAASEAILQSYNLKPSSIAVEGEDDLTVLTKCKWKDGRAPRDKIWYMTEVFTITAHMALAILVPLPLFITVGMQLVQATNQDPNVVFVLYICVILCTGYVFFCILSIVAYYMNLSWSIRGVLQFFWYRLMFMVGFITLLLIMFALIWLLFQSILNPSVILSFGTAFGTVLVHGKSVVSRQNDAKEEIDGMVFEKIDKHISAHIPEPEDLFGELDEDGSGSIGFEEFLGIFERVGVPITRMKALRIFEMVNSDGSDSIGPLEFGSAFQKLREMIAVDVFAELGMSSTDNMIELLKQVGGLVFLQVGVVAGASEGDAGGSLGPAFTVITGLIMNIVQKFMSQGELKKKALIVDSFIASYKVKPQEGDGSQDGNSSDSDKESESSSSKGKSKKKKKDAKDESENKEQEPSTLENLAAGFAG